MSILSVVICIALLVLLTARWNINPFIAFLITAISGGVMLGIPLDKIPDSVEKGMGGILGSLTAIICLGAMFGKLIADSGAAQKITAVLIQFCGEKYIAWALMLTGFFVGIPLFYNVGFVLLVPLVFSVAYQTKLPAVYLGIPLLAALSVTHGFLPPHPSPTALVPQFQADMGLTLIYGLVVGLPTMMIAGPIFSRFLKNIHSEPLSTFTPQIIPDHALPSTGKSFFVALLPVLMLSLASVLTPLLAEQIQFKPYVSFFGNPLMVMLVSLIIATYSLGLARGHTLKSIMQTYTQALKDISVILLIIAGAGALKQIFVDSGVSTEIAAGLKNIPVNPLFLGWLIALIIRICLGSATVAGLTAAGIVAPLVLASPSINPNLMVLAIGAGSLMCSHVNDSGFWMYKEYFNLSLKQTFASWSVMETIVGTLGLIGVLLLDVFV
ncbi:idonate transporter [Cellvibrio zantedeschiae]|uniref:Idonate transporter n=1 Tax=Cellvibrio zantedeschiae TaxID=1237077 RepID=A0ABQ3AW74_9GAMM|nr:gluconate:H+ symporter [Cellvibrio zantedeschiae]GGY65838.1 idonate transporter [Cellvibrio zantedeschiae]